MREIQLLALDLDGTLTNKEKKVSDKNKHYIKLAQRHNVKIVLASGRPVIGINNVATALDLWNSGGYILAYNGGQIIDCKSRKNLIKQCIPMEYYHEICTVNKKFDVYPLSYNDSGVISESDTNKYVIQEGFNNSVPIYKVSNLEETITEPVVKFMIVGDPKELKKTFSYLTEIFDGKLNIFFSEPYFMEITPLGIEKASSLERLSGILGLSKENVMACGDGLNDIPMLKYAGLSICMDNGYEETKKCADYIVPSNDNDGVAFAIQKYILEDI